MRLHQLQNGQCAYIIKIHMHERETKRLFYLGIYEGSEIIRVYCAPCHDPVLYWVNATQIVLRNQDAACIEVKEIPSCIQ